VQKAQESCPDLAIIDFQMPMMDGLKATRKIKRLMPGLPILLFTLYSSPQLEWESKRAGADAVLLKMEGSTGLPGVMYSLLPKPLMVSPSAHRCRSEFGHRQLNRPALKNYTNGMHCGLLGRGAALRNFYRLRRAECLRSGLSRAA